jgi:hypothetical protein
MSRFSLCIIFLVSFVSLHAQHLFPVKFTDCNTNSFALEKDVLTAIVDDSTLTEVLTHDMDSGVRDSINGSLFLQIIVDIQGTSCLISFENKTNVQTSYFDYLKKSIDNSLVWKNGNKKIAALVEIIFEGSMTSIKRFGFGRNGLQRLR